MTQTTKPDRYQVREYLKNRTKEKGPPPTPEEIRRQLGWYMVPHNGTVPEVAAL